MVTIFLKKNEGRIEDYVMIHTGNKDHPSSMVESNNVDVLLKFRDGKLKSFTSSGQIMLCVEKLKDWIKNLNVHCVFGHKMEYIPEIGDDSEGWYCSVCDDYIINLFARVKK